MCTQVLSRFTAMNIWSHLKNSTCVTRTSRPALTIPFFFLCIAATISNNVVFAHSNQVTSRLAINWICWSLKPHFSRVLRHGSPVHNGSQTESNEVGLITRPWLSSLKSCGVGTLSCLTIIFCHIRKGSPPRYNTSFSSTRVTILSISLFSQWKWWNFKEKVFGASQNNSHHLNEFIFKPQREVNCFHCKREM